MRGRISASCPSVPQRSRFGPDCRSAIQCAATGAPAASSSSVTAYRSIAERSCPPYSLGQVIPSQPRSPSFFENDGSTPDSHVSTWLSKVPPLSSAARNSRTSSRTRSAADDRGAGANVNELLLMQRGSWCHGWVAPAERSAAERGSLPGKVHVREQHAGPRLVALVHRDQHRRDRREHPRLPQRSDVPPRTTGHLGSEVDDARTRSGVVPADQ